MHRSFFLLIPLLFTVQISAQKDTATAYFSNGVVESVIPFDNGLRDGVAKFYFENGNIKEQRTYVAGRVEGEVKRFYENGKPKEFFSILNGKRDGATTTYDSLGNYLADVYYSEGKIQKEDQQTDEDIVEERDSTDAEQKDSTIAQTPAAVSFVPSSTEKIETKPKPIPNEVTGDSSVYRNPAIFPEPVMGYKLFYEKVVYPKTAKEKKVQGTVLIKALINQYGEVEKAEIVKGIGMGCEDAAQIAVEYTKFYPGIVDGKPVKVEMIIPIEFKP